MKTITKAKSGIYALNIVLIIQLVFSRLLNIFNEISFFGILMFISNTIYLFKISAIDVCKLCFRRRIEM